MKKLIINILRKFGILVITLKALKKNSPKYISDNYKVDENTIPLITSLLNGGLKEHLIKEGRKKWLDIGCGATFDKYFTYIDIYPETLINRKDRYFRMDIINLSDSDFDLLGKYDLVRMQHVFEHFTPEDGIKVLNNCHKLLNDNGYLLITTPDLKKYIALYLNGSIRDNFDWALKRICADSPDSFYFSIFTHSLIFEKHKWCYDADGIIYQLNKTGLFKDIKEIKLGDKMSNVPFTHNRPKEDVCILCKKG